MQRFLFASLILFAAAPTFAQDWAKARLDKSPRHHEYTDVKQGDRKVNCFVAYPEVKDKAAAVIVIHENKGLTDWAKSAADQFAEAGYIAIAPDLLSGTGEKGGNTDSFKSESDATKAIGSLKQDVVVKDLDAVADYVEKLPSCNGKLAVIGFCWGGGQSFNFATQRSDLKLAMVCYGVPPKGSLDKIPCPVLGFYGGMDNRIDSTIPDTEKAMKAAKKTYEPVTYEGAGHGFMRAGEDPAGTEPNKKARDAAWKRIKENLGKI